MPPLIARSQSLFATLVVFSCSLFLFGRSFAQDTNVASPIGTAVTIDAGPLRGVQLEDGVHAYLGIPYAEPPLGELRWRPPFAVSTWQETRDASKFGPIAVQPKLQIELYAAEPLPQSEDCLTLNVWTAAESADERRPVMVWIHGGALIYGSGNMDGAPLAKKGVVLVSINYRLGPFGFLAHPELSAESDKKVSGNQGFLDQIAALEWVRDNIANFGGDPNRVTIFGESAGSLSVSALMISRRARRLFHGAIGQSGSIFANQFPLRVPEGTEKPKRGFASAEDLGVEFGKSLGADGENSLAQMRRRSADDVLAAWNAEPAFTDYYSLPVIDNWVFEGTAAEVFAESRHNDVPLILGSNADEGTAIAPAVAPHALASKTAYEAWIRGRLGKLADRALALYPAATDEDVTTAVNNAVCDEMFTWAMRTWAQGTSSGKSPAYLYYFSRVPPIPESETLGAYHAAEIGYVFGTLTDPPYQSTDMKLSEAMSDAWARFAKTGDPNGGGLPAWSPYSSDDEPYLEFGDEIRAGTALRSEKVQLWKDFYESGGRPPVVERSESE